MEFLVVPHIVWVNEEEFWLFKLVIFPRVLSIFHEG